MVRKLEDDLDWALTRSLPLSSKILSGSFLVHHDDDDRSSFRLGKMYRYTLEQFDPESMANFVDGFYKNLPAESIPPPKSPL